MDLAILEMLFPSHDGVNLYKATAAPSSLTHLLILSVYSTANEGANDVMLVT